MSSQSVTQARRWLTPEIRRDPVISLPYGLVWVVLGVGDHFRNLGVISTIFMKNILYYACYWYSLNYVCAYDHTTVKSLDLV